MRSPFIDANSFRDETRGKRWTACRRATVYSSAYETRREVGRPSEKDDDNVVVVVVVDRTNRETSLSDSRRLDLIHDVPVVPDTDGFMLEMTYAAIAPLGHVERRNDTRRGKRAVYLKVNVSVFHSWANFSIINIKDLDTFSHFST